MEARFRAQQKMLSLSDCQDLCGRTSREIAEIAPLVGWHGLSSHGLSLAVGAGVDLMIIVDAMGFGVEPQSIARIRHGLRIEALLKAGEDASSWSLGLSGSDEKDFWPMLWGARDAVHPRIARILGVHSDAARRVLRYHTQADVEQLTNVAYEIGSYSDRPPRFTIDAHQLASRLKSCVSGPLFDVTVSSS